MLKRKNKISGRWLAAAGLFLCLMAGAVTVYADPGDEGEINYYETIGEITPDDSDIVPPAEAPAEVPVDIPAEVPQEQPVEAVPEVQPETERSFSMNGNLTIIDDVISAIDGHKEFLTVSSKEGDQFYIIIDRDSNGMGNVYFLNLVDEEDLYSLTGIMKEDSPVSKAYDNICICTDKCAVGDVNTDCAICRNDTGKCEGTESLIKLPDKENEEGAGAAGTADSEDGAAEETPETNYYALGIGAAALIFLIVLYAKKIKKPRKHAVRYYDDDLEEEDDDDIDDTSRN